MSYAERCLIMLAAGFLRAAATTTPRHAAHGFVAYDAFMPLTLPMLLAIDAMPPPCHDADMRCLLMSPTPPCRLPLLLLRHYATPLMPRYRCCR